jgi:hypothetical protein
MADRIVKSTCHKIKIGPTGFNDSRIDWVKSVVKSMVKTCNNNEYDIELYEPDDILRLLERDLIESYDDLPTESYILKIDRDMEDSVVEQIKAKNIFARKISARPVYKIKHFMPHYIDNIVNIKGVLECQPDIVVGNI